MTVAIHDNSLLLTVVRPRGHREVVSPRNLAGLIPGSGGRTALGGEAEGNGDAAVELLR